MKTEVAIHTLGKPVVTWDSEEEVDPTQILDYLNLNFGPEEDIDLLAEGIDRNLEVTLKLGSREQILHLPVPTTTDFAQLAAVLRTVVERTVEVHNKGGRSSKTLDLSESYLGQMFGQGRHTGVAYPSTSGNYTLDPGSLTQTLEVTEMRLANAYEKRNLHIQADKIRWLLSEEARGPHKIRVKTGRHAIDSLILFSVEPNVVPYELGGIRGRLSPNNEATVTINMNNPTRELLIVTKGGPPVDFETELTMVKL